MCVCLNPPLNSVKGFCQETEKGFDEDHGVCIYKPNNISIETPALVARVMFMLSCHMAESTTKQHRTTLMIIHNIHNAKKQQQQQKTKAAELRITTYDQISNTNNKFA